MEYGTRGAGGPLAPAAFPTANYLLASYARLRLHVPLTPCRLALLRSFTVEPLVPLLQAAAGAHGIALEALEHHPGMLLRPQHFAAWRINWQDKGQNLRELAAELQRATSLKDFYASLQQEVDLLPVDAASLTRVAQLTQKTNQFNTTTRRYSEQQISTMAESREWDVYSVRMRDRLGDNGIIGVVIVHDADDVSDIDTFLLSCRVIGRGVETSILSFLVERARARQLRQVQGWFLPTKKNAPARHCYAEHHMQALAEHDGDTLWALDLATQDIACPAWIRLTTCEGVLSR